MTDDLQKFIAEMEASNPQLKLDREVVGKMFDYEARALAAEARDLASAYVYVRLVRDLRGFLDRADVRERMPMHLAADLDQIVTDSEMGAREVGYVVPEQS